MYLTGEEEAILDGANGGSEALAMRILVNLGDVESADRLIPIKSAHISGVSFRTGGEGLVKFLERMANMGASVKVPSSLNPAGMDLARWREMGVPEVFSEIQMRIIRYYSEMGVKTTCACIPYEMAPIVREISMGDHLAWSESNAVIYANSIVGARTNREGGPSSLASALTGKTPNYGMHLPEERAPTMEVRVRSDLDDLDFNLLGAYVGKEFPGDQAIFRGLKYKGRGPLKQLGAALAAKGGHPIFHIEGITPEAYQYPPGFDVRESIDITGKQLKNMKDELYPPEPGEPSIYVLGCPQFGCYEFERLASLVRGKKLKNGIRIWVFTGRDMVRTVDPELISTISDSGVEIFHDTCMVVTPLDEMGIERVGTDSAKAAHYIPRLLGPGASLLPLEMIVERAMK
jgi:predicted aconitase